MKNQTKIQGTFLIGITQTFYSLNAITELELDQFIEDINPHEWYPIDYILKIFKALQNQGNYSNLIYQAGAHFIQSWYDNMGKELGLGAIGHLWLQDNSAGIQLVFKDYNPDILYSKVIHVDENKGLAILEFSDMLPKEFSFGVFYNGIYMWGDLLWLDASYEIIEETDLYTKCRVTYRFKKQDETYTNDFLDEFIDQLNIDEPPEISPGLSQVLAWKLKGLRKDLALERQMNTRSNEVLGLALQKQVSISKELEKANEKIKTQSHMDFLTGIYNKRYFNNEFLRLYNRCLRRQESVSVMMIDIDFFKNYNDTYGHLQGDKALVRVARCIADVAKRSDDIYARFGGEEFIIATSDITYDQLCQFAQVLMKRIHEENIQHESSSISDRVTVSIGCVTIDASLQMSLERIIKAADMVLYEAKNTGRNKFMAKKIDIL